jgi:hypothetical protein
MKYVIGIAICFVGLSSHARPDDLDPVLRAKAHRAVRDSQDLPPIPRGLTEPPPLPPPELHTHDIKRHRRGAARAGKARPGRRPAARGARPQAKAAKAPAKGQAKAKAKPAGARAKKRPAGRA